VIAVFLGPSLRAGEARRLLPGARIFPPARQGDVWRVLRLRPRAIALIDGVFEAQPSVWHREILDAMDAGVPVVGAASMGALRAAELCEYGMRGAGRIFRWYRDGVLRDDAEVALLHASAEHAYRPLTVPLVNVRWAADAAVRQRVLSRPQARALVRVAAAMFYQERTWDVVLRALPRSARERWSRFDPPDLKADDARVALREVARIRPRGAAPHPRALPSHARMRRLVDLDVPHDPDLADQGTRRLLLAALARVCGLVPTRAELAAAARRWEGSLAAKAPMGWQRTSSGVAAQGIDAAEAQRMTETLALERLALDWSSRLVPDGPSREEGLALETRLRGATKVRRRQLP
jgi:hypothetical protein